MQVKKLKEDHKAALEAAAKDHAGKAEESMSAIVFEKNNKINEIFTEKRALQ